MGGYTFSGSAPSAFSYASSASSVHLEAVFSDAADGQMYRIMSASGNGSATANPVAAGGTVAYLQCLSSTGSVTGEAAMSSNYTMGSPYNLYAGSGYAAFKDSSGDWQRIKLNACGSFSSTKAPTSAPTNHDHGRRSFSRSTRSLLSSDSAPVTNLLYGQPSVAEMVESVSKAFQKRRNEREMDKIDHALAERKYKKGKR